MSLSLLQQREIEAKILAPVYRAFAKEVGDVRAREILAEVVRDLATQSGCDAAMEIGGHTVSDLRPVVERWRNGGALELEVIRDDGEALEFNVTRCRYAEMYHRLGLAELGPILSCSRDAAMIDGFNPEIEFHRSHTIMEGADHCDFHFHHPDSQTD